jgi:5-methylcytosine-specific restriction endonuclease McrA
MIGQNLQEKLRYIQDLLGHELPSGDLEQVLEGACDVYIEALEKRKFAATHRPRQSQRPSRNPRHVPVRVKRAVWERDGGQCTFVSKSGHRCEARKLLEFDHVQEVARGGRATEANLRLRCRAHNQYGAECTFGAGFMREKREAARPAAEAQRNANAAQARAAAEEVITPLRILGFTAEEARRGAAECESIAGDSLEKRMRHALAYLRPRLRRSAPAAS